MNRLELIDVADRNLGRMLQLQAEQNGDGVFLIEDETRVTFAEANRKVNSIANGLKSLGLGRGDRLAFFMGSAIEVIYLVLAVNKLRAVWIPINTDYKGDWLRDTLNDSKPKIIVADETHLPRLEEVIEHVPHKHVLVLGNNHSMLLPTLTRPFASLLEHPDKEFDLSSVHYGEVSAVLWTSGTTGKSKGVMQSHNIWINACESGARSWGTRTGDVIYNILPLYNSAAWSANILRGLYEGIPSALDPRFSVSNFWDRIRYFNASQTFTLGAIHMFLWRAPPKPNDRDNPLRSAGMVPMPEELVGPFCERFGIERLFQGYGQSETLGVLSRTGSPDRKWKPGALGEASELVDVELCDDDGGRVTAGIPGEFCVRPKKPHTIFEGYFENPEATRAAFRGEWFRTGDLGKYDEEGNFYFVDRKKDALRYKGRNISSLEAEAAVRKHEAVADVAAFGVKSKELDSEDELKINVVLKPGASVTAEALARFINDTAPYFFVPRYIEFVESLPYTPTSKVQKYQLREAGVTAATWDREATKFELVR
jgi:crotonobetaine/carnitine-CoA ligase